MSGFQPEKYENPKALEILHNSFRVRGDNDFNIPADGNFQLSVDDPSVEYFIGIAAGPLIALIVFVIWCFALLCVKCCRDRCACCGNKGAVIFFTGFMALSCFGWFYSISGSARASSGVSTLLDSSDSLTGLLQEVETEINEALSFTTLISTAINNSDLSCEDVFLAAGQSFPISNLTELNNGADFSLSNITGDITDAQASFDEIVDQARPYLDRWQYAYIIVVSCVIALTVLFTLATLWRVADWLPGSDSRFAGCLGKTSSWIFFTIGILLLLLLWIIIFILAVVSTAGADLCTPNPSANLNRFLEEILQNDLNGTLCDTTPYSYLCYYQTCVGSNPLELDVLEPEALVEDLVGQVDELSSLINDTITTAMVPIPNSDECIEAVQNISTLAGNIPNEIQDVIDAISCPNVNEIYNEIVNQGLCRDTMGGIAVAWISLALGAASLMAALLTYRIFEFDKDEFMEAQVASYGKE